MSEKDRLDTIYKICCNKNIFFKYSNYIEKNNSRYKRSKNKKQQQIEERKIKLEKKKAISDILNIIQNSEHVKPAEQIVIKLYFLQRDDDGNQVKYTQRQIAYILKVQQPYISKLIKRILNKIFVLYYRTYLTEHEMKKTLGFLDEKHFNTLLIYIKQINQEKVAKIINKKQTTVSVRLNKIKNKIIEYIGSNKRDKNIEDIKKFLEFFDKLREYNFYPNFCIRSSDKHIKVRKEEDGA